MIATAHSQLTCIKPCQADGAVVSLSTGGRKKETSGATRTREKINVALGMRPNQKDGPVSCFQGISSNFQVYQKIISKTNFPNKKK